MARFSPEELRRVLRKEAEDDGVAYEDFIAGIDILLQGKLSGIECVLVKELADGSLPPEKLAHIKQCEACCQRIVKFFHMSCATTAERKGIARAIARKQKVPLQEVLERYGVHVPESEDECLEFEEIILCDSLSEERKEHIKQCPHCNTHIIILQVMDMPTLE